MQIFGEKLAVRAWESDRFVSPIFSEGSKSRGTDEPIDARGGRLASEAFPFPLPYIKT